MTDDPSETNLRQTILQTIKESKPQTVQQLVSLIKEKTSTPEHQILQTVLKLEDEGKISFSKQTPPAPLKLSAYLKTEETTWYWATLATAIATTVAVFAIPEDSYPLVYIRYVLGAIFVLWLPGYAFIKALFPAQVQRKPSKEGLDTVERTALSLGMSLALVPIVGLLLNYTPWGIRLTPIVLSLLALTIVFATAAIMREHQSRTKQTKEE